MGNNNKSNDNSSNNNDNKRESFHLEDKKVSVSICSC